MVEVEFNDGVPAGVVTFGILNGVVLCVFLQAGERHGQGRVDVFEVMAELGRSEIWAAVQDDHEFEHWIG